MATVTLVVGVVGTPSTTDAKLKTELEALGHTVTYIDDGAAEDTSRDLVVIAESSAAATIGTKYRNITTPLLVCEEGAWDAMDFVATEASTGSSGTTIDITGAGHAAAGGLSGDGVVIFSAARNRGYTNATGFGTGVAHIADIGGTTGDRFCFVYESGATMANGHAAENRRAGLGFSDNSGDAWGANAVILFAAVVNWLAGSAAAKLSADTGTGADASSAHASSAADTGTGVDASVPGQELAASDTGAGADAGTAASASELLLVVVDTGTGEETLSILDTGDSEAGVGSDEIGLLLLRTFDDGAGVDAGDADVGSPAFIGSETGIGVDAATLTIVGVSAGRDVIAYVVEILDSGATFGPGTKLGELWDLRNLGWSAYDRIPGKAFFTLSQRSDMLSLITPLTTHIRIWRLTPALTTLVYTGAIIDYDAAGDDVVFSAYDYLALLSISRSGYRTLYPTKALGSAIVSPEWTLAKNATSSPLGFVATGTIEDPVGTDGTTVIKTNAQFGLLDQMRLQLFFDLSEIGRANTINHTTFGISRTTTPTFTFEKNKGANIDMGLVLNGNVSDYRHLPNWTSYRNDLATIGTTVGGGATEVVVKDDTAAAAKGRRQDVFTIKTLLGIVGAATTADQQRAASERMLKSAVSLQPTLQLKLIRGGIDFFNGFDLCDKPIVEIGNGIDSITGRWRILGARATFDEDGEAPSLIVQPVAT